MATLGNSARVGLAVIVAAVLFTAMMMFFKGDPFFSKTYAIDVTFDDASGIAKDSLVQWAGVQIGTVKDVKLVGLKAVLTLQIYKKKNIPIGSDFQIVVPVLGTQGYVNVIPPADAAKHPDKVIAAGATNLVGDRSGDLQTSLKNVNELLDQLTISAKKANLLLDNAGKLAGDPKIRENLEATVTNFKLASANGVRLTDQMNTALLEDNRQIQALLKETERGAKIAIDNIDDTTGSMKSAIGDNKNNINEIVENLRDTSAALEGITSQTNDMLKNGGIAKNMEAIVGNLNATTQKLNTIAGDVEKISGDSGVQTDLKATVHNIRETSEQTSVLVERLSHLAGGKKKAAAVIVAPVGGGAVIVTPPVTPVKVNANIPLALPLVDLIQNTRTSHFRSDVNAIVPFGQSGTFLRAGIYGLGDTNNLNFQFGKTLDVDAMADYRVGLYASKLSVGADFGLGRKTTISLDAYDPNNYHIDAHGIVMLNDTLGLILGEDDIARHSGTVVGVEYRSSH